VGFILSLNDLLSFSITKWIYVKHASLFYLIVPAFFYAFQMPLFFYGLKISTMTVLNIVWNLVSNILVTLVGVFFFKEKIGNIKMIAMLIGLFSLVLFALDGVF